MFVIIFLVGVFSGHIVQGEFNKERAIYEHNRLREFHGSPPLVEDAALSAEAQKRAEFLATLLPDISKAKNPEAGRANGENEISYTEKDVDEDLGVILVQTLYSQILGYEWPRTAFKPEVEPFIEIVWKASNKIGVGHVNSGPKGGVVVFRYSPDDYQEKDEEANVPPLMPGLTKDSFKEQSVSQR